MTTQDNMSGIPDNLGTQEPAGRPLPIDADALLYPAEAAHLMCLSTGTLANWRVQGKGPAFVMCGKNCRYRRADVLQWIAENRFTSTSEAGVKQ